jgi:hypothetical protein
MSMNIHLEMSREILVKKTLHTCFQTESIDLWQTPTEVSYAIQNSNTPLEEYQKWVLSVSKDEEEDVSENDDFFCTGKPVGKETLNIGKSHIEDLVIRIRILEAVGYEQNWYVM